MSGVFEVNFNSYIYNTMTISTKLSLRGQIYLLLNQSLNDMNFRSSQTSNS